jgi:hypothetical protein
MTTVRAILIPADSAEPISEVQLVVKPGSDTLDSLQRLVGGLIAVVRYPDRDDVTTYVNDEGKFDPEAHPSNRRATRLLESVLWAEDWIAGALVIAGFDPSTGETIDLPADLTVETLNGVLV